MYGGTQPSVNELRFPGLQGGALAQRVHPFGLPMPVLVLEFDAVLIRDAVHKGFQFFGRNQSGVQGEVLPHYLFSFLPRTCQLSKEEFSENHKI